MSFNLAVPSRIAAGLGWPRSARWSRSLGWPGDLSVPRETAPDLVLTGPDHGTTNLVAPRVEGSVDHGAEIVPDHAAIDHAAAGDAAPADPVLDDTALGDAVLDDAAPGDAVLDGTAAHHDDHDHSATGLDLGEDPDRSEKDSPFHLVEGVVESAPSDVVVSEAHSHAETGAVAVNGSPDPAHPENPARCPVDLWGA